MPVLANALLSWVIWLGHEQARRQPEVHGQAAEPRDRDDVHVAVAGLFMAPTRTASRRTSGVSMYVTAAVTSRVRTYSRTGHQVLTDFVRHHRQL